MAEDDRLAAVPRPGELGEDEAHHEGLDEAAEDSLEGHEDHGLGALGGGLPRAVADGVLGLEGEEEAGGEVLGAHDAGDVEGGVAGHDQRVRVPVEVADQVVQAAWDRTRELGGGGVEILPKSSQDP